MQVNILNFRRCMFKKGMKYQHLKFTLKSFIKQTCTDTHIDT